MQAEQHGTMSRYFRYNPTKKTVGLYLIVGALPQSPFIKHSNNFCTSYFVVGVFYITKKRKEIIMTAQKKYELQRPIQKKFRVSKEENEYINKKVEASIFNNFQNFARMMLINGEVKYVDYSELRTLNSEVNRIGNNVNQLAKLAHLFNEISPEEVAELEKILSDLKELVSNKLDQEIRTEKIIGQNEEQITPSDVINSLIENNKEESN
ncbi:plasmid mobilization protein [Weissella muntiaci]